MNHAIAYKDMTHSDATCCRGLCNALMRHQASAAEKYSDLLSKMTFENRLQASFSKAQCKKLIVAYDQDAPIGYVYGEIFEVTPENIGEFKPFADQVSEEDAQGHGLIPPALGIPAWVADLVNLYVEPAYRSAQVGKELTTQMIEWFRQNKEVSCWLVYVSNGNNPGTFYQKFGFTYSHEVLNGLITCYSHFTKAD
ncbi:MAG: GNAT family N-acetyltransferase [Eubacteriales bacterium]|nr:GNAT family N-acetyltransferase [Eubacteriales bacterium]